jgi:hypothetical protein
MTPAGFKPIIPASEQTARPLGWVEFFNVLIHKFSEHKLFCNPAVGESRHKLPGPSGAQETPGPECVLIFSRFSLAGGPEYFVSPGSKPAPGVRVQ